MKDVVVVAYGAGNVASVQFALERLGARVRLTADPQEIEQADRVVLPGVGAAAHAMARMRALGLVDAIRDFQRPLLGVCLGQQLLFQSSEEGGETPLLGLIPGRVSRLVPTPDHPVPHMGWSRLFIDRADPLLEGVVCGEHVYFVHAFVCPDGPATIARAECGVAAPAVVRQGLRWGCQFHPERSAAAGARILANFLEIEA